MGFLLNQLPGGRTRLVIGGYEAFRPRWLGRLYSHFPVVWVMQARTLAVLKRNIERAAVHERKRSPLEGPPRVRDATGQVQARIRSASPRAHETVRD